MNETITWHFVANGDLPDSDVTCLVATENPDTDEVEIGAYDGVRNWFQNEPEFGTSFIKHPVYAWAYAPSKPRRCPPSLRSGAAIAERSKGGAS